MAKLKVQGHRGPVVLLTGLSLDLAGSKLIPSALRRDVPVCPSTPPRLPNPRSKRQWFEDYPSANYPGRVYAQVFESDK
jgi:hypothetical protein